MINPQYVLSKGCYSLAYFLTWVHMEKSFVKKICDIFVMLDLFFYTATIP